MPAGCHRHPHDPDLYHLLERALTGLTGKTTATAQGNCGNVVLHCFMKLILFFLFLIVSFGVWVFFLGGPVLVGIVLGMILMTTLVVYLAGGFHKKA